MSSGDKGFSEEKNPSDHKEIKCSHKSQHLVLNAVSLVVVECKLVLLSNKVCMHTYRHERSKCFDVHRLIVSPELRIAPSGITFSADARAKSLSLNFILQAQKVATGAKL
jgi:hypothetical protein